MLLLWLGIVYTADAAPRGVAVGWGTNWATGSSVPFGGTNVVAVASGRGHMLGLTLQGTVVASGENTFGQCRPPAGLSGVMNIDAGRDFSLALLSNGTVRAWGRNDSGQTTVPAGLNTVKAIAAGAAHSLALKKNGTVVGWGANNAGQARTTGLTGIKAIAAGRNFSLALRSNGTVVAWGDNTYGQRNIPAGLANVVAIAAGELHGVALKSNGRVIAWPSNYYQSVLLGGAAIAAGYDFTLTLLSNRTVVVWGRDGLAPVGIPGGLTNVTAIAAGDYDALALTRGPFIRTQPRDVTTAVGNSALFLVQAAGLEPLRYQWRRNGILVPGATNSTFVVSVPRKTDSSDLSVTVSNAFGITASRSVRLEVVDGPTFTKLLPAATIVNAGTNITFEVAATGGAPLTYQWYFGSAALAGEVAPRLVISNVQLRHAGRYSAVAINGGGRTTNATQLFVSQSPPVFLTQPTNVYAIPGAKVRFQAEASGTEPLTYSWRLNGVDIPDGTSSVLTLDYIGRWSEGTYTVTVHSGAGDASASAHLQVARVPDFEWARGSGTPKRSEGQGIAADSAGNVFVTGDFGGTGLFGDTSYAARMLDIFVAKFNPSGQLLWADKWGTAGDDHGRKVAVDAQGNACVIGTFWNGYTNGSFGSDYFSDTFISKYDPAGNLLWRRNIRGEGWCAYRTVGNDIALDRQGNILVSGSYEGLSVNFGTTNLPTPSCFGIYVAKFSPAGNLVWADLRGSISGSADATALACGPTGDVFVTGWFSGELALNQGSLVTDEYSDILVARYSGAGNLLWATNAGALTNWDRGVNIAVDAAGNAYVTGIFSGDARFGDLDVATQAEDDSWDTFIAKYDNTGRAIWVRQISPASSQEEYGLHVTAAGYALFAASFIQADFGETVVTSPHREDTCFAIYDPEGNLVLVRPLDASVSPQGNWTSDFAIDDHGNAYFTGWFSSQIHFGPLHFFSSVEYEPGYLPMDCFIAKMRDATAVTGPRLTITRSEDRITLSWPVAAVGYSLEMLDDLNNFSDPVTLHHTDTPDRFTLSITWPADSSAKFFRLFRPFMENYDPQGN